MSEINLGKTILWSPSPTWKLLQARKIMELSFFLTLLCDDIIPATSPGHRHQKTEKLTLIFDSSKYKTKETLCSSLITIPFSEMQPLFFFLSKPLFSTSSTILWSKLFCLTNRVPSYFTSHQRLEITNRSIHHDPTTTKPNETVANQAKNCKDPSQSLFRGSKWNYQLARS